MEKPLSLKSNRTLRITYNLPISKTAKFWEELKEGRILATKCVKCGRIHFPPVVNCGACSSSEIEWIELGGEGKIVTFTEVYVKPASFANEPPYIVVIARLKEGVKALAWLTGVERKHVKVGMNVKLSSKVTLEGRVAYEFVAI